jgi:hypothetical protein
MSRFGIGAGRAAWGAAFALLITGMAVAGAQDAAYPGVATESSATAAADTSAARPTIASDLNVVLRVVDTPSDGGTSLRINWDADPARASVPGLAAGTLVAIERRSRADATFASVASAEFGDGRFVDEGLDPDSTYSYRLTAATANGSLHASPATAPVAPRENAFRLQRVNALVAILLMTGLVGSFIMAARRGRNVYIRRISGLDAIDEAVGRATEMGRKILYVPGIISVSEPQTLASLGILGYVAKLTARYGAELEVPNIDALAMAAAREIVKQSYMEEGHPESFREDMVHYITDDQFAYAAALSGIMVRDRPAANFLIGWFAAESLLLAETGQSINAIQIAGTAQVAQLPFFVSACDYTMLGEELFAASAYLSKDPLILGSIAGQDMMKVAIAAVVVIGIVLGTVGMVGFADWFTAL